MVDGTRISELTLFVLPHVILSFCSDKGFILVLVVVGCFFLFFVGG